jgi:acyl-CoA dehydrogenase
VLVVVVVVVVVVIVIVLFVLQVFGGNSYVRGGVGERVERIYRETRVLAIGGGSEEIMLDLTARMAKL